MTTENSIERANFIHKEWDDAWAANDIERILAIYHDDIVVESPLVSHLLERDSGVIHGKSELRHLMAIATKRKPVNRGHYRESLFTDGTTLIWEYPRLTPKGEQMDFVEMMRLKEGLIIKHRIYWGWVGVKIILNDQYHHSDQ